MWSLLDFAYLLAELALSVLTTVLGGILPGLPRASGGDPVSLRGSSDPGLSCDLGGIDVQGA